MNILKTTESYSLRGRVAWSMNYIPIKPFPTLPDVKPRLAGPHPHRPQTPLLGPVLSTARIEPGATQSPLHLTSGHVQLQDCHISMLPVVGKRSACARPERPHLNGPLLTPNQRFTSQITVTITLIITATIPVHPLSPCPSLHPDD